MSWLNIWRRVGPAAARYSGFTTRLLLEQDLDTITNRPDQAKAFKKQFALNISIKWQSTVKPSLDEQLSPHKPSKSLLPSTLKPPCHILSSPQISAPPSRMVRPPSVPLGFCRAVGGPTVPQHPPPPRSSTSSSQGHFVSTVSPTSSVVLLCKLCEAAGVGQPLYEMYYSHAVPDGFLYFTYKVCMPGITTAFKGLVMILPGPTATATLEEARQAAAQQVLQRLYSNQLNH